MRNLHTIVQLIGLLGFHILKLCGGIRPRKPIDLLPLPINSRISESGEDFSMHIQLVQEEIRQRLAVNNDLYKWQADKHCRSVEFAEGDLVMMRLRPKCVPQYAYQKLHSKKAGPFKILKILGTNAYVLKLPDDFADQPYC